MGILDDAIREHLDLKRRHGARDAELREIEDEAFGSGDQPDPFVAGELYAEAGSAEPPDAGNEDPTRLVEAEALRPTEPPVDAEPLRPTEATSEPDRTLSEPEAEPEAFRPSEPRAEPEPGAEIEALRPSEPEPETMDQPAAAEPPSPIPGQVELPGQDEIPGQGRLDAEPEPPAASESLEELIAEEEPFPEDTAAPPPVEPAEPEPESRSLEPEPEAQAPPEPSVPDPPPPPPEPGAEPPGRARGRIDVPTQEHPPPGDTGDLPPLPGDEPELGRPDTTYEPPPMDLPAEEPSSTEHRIPAEEPISNEEPLPEEASSSSEGPQLYDFETDEDSIPEDSGESAVDDDFEALGPAEESAPYLDEEEPYSEEPASGVESGGYTEEETAIRPAVEDDETRGRKDSRDRGERRSEQEEDDLWFEKGPPKDFDFDD